MKHKSSPEVDLTLGIGKWMVCDGGVFKKDKKVIGGYCSFYFSYDGKTHSKERLSNAAKTTNESEYIAFLTCVVHLASHSELRKIFSGTTIYMDSQLVVNQVNGLWRVNAENLRPFYQQARKYVETYDLRLKWVPRAFVVSILGH